MKKRIKKKIKKLKKFHFGLNENVPRYQTIIKENLTPVLICLVTTAMPEIDKELISAIYQRYILNDAS